MDGVGQLDSVDPGMSFNGAIGLAYAISYALSMNVQFQYGYNMSTDYDFTNGGSTHRRPTAQRPSSVGTGWRISPKTTLSLSVGVGLTTNDPDFFFMFRLPFSYMSKTMIDRTVHETETIRLHSSPVDLSPVPSRRRGRRPF